MRVLVQLSSGVLVGVALVSCNAQVRPSDVDFDSTSGAPPDTPDDTTGAPETTTITAGPETTGGEEVESSSSEGGEGAVYDVFGTPDAPGSVEKFPCEDNTADAALLLIPCAPTRTLADPFTEDYECYEYTSIPGVPSLYGGATFSLTEPDTLLIGGHANTEAGRLYAITVTRDASCHITGFAEAMAQDVAAAEYNDGGMVYAPNGTLVLARWPVNELGQLVPGDVATTRVDSMELLGVSAGGLDAGTAAIAFVPGDFPNEGAFKLMTWSSGLFYSMEIADAGDGTYDILSATYELELPGGPEGFVYISEDNAQVDAPSMLLSEFSAGNVVMYEIDENANPIPSTRRDFIPGLTGAEGAHIDPSSGDFLFTTFGGGDVFVSVRGFHPNSQPPAG